MEHTQYMISGLVKVVMDDSRKKNLVLEVLLVVSPGHNAWVVGNEPAVGIDFTGLNNYAKEGGPPVPA